MTRSEKSEWFVWCFLLNFLCYSLTFFLSLVLLFDAASATVPSRRLRIGQQSASDSGQINMTLAKQATQALTEGVQLYNQGKGTVESQQKAIEKLQEAVKFWRQARDQRGEAYSFMFLGLVYNKDNVGDKHKALDCYNQALRLFRVVGDGGNGAEVSTLTSIGTLYDDLGNKQKALEFYNQALSRVQAMKDLPKEVIILNSIGKVYSNWGRKDEALEFFNKALSLSQRLNDQSLKATGIGQPANTWTLIATETKDYSTPTYYDKNSVRRNGDIVLVRIATKNQVGFLRLSCSRATLATSVNGRNFDSPMGIAPRTSVAVLYHMFCH